MILQEVNANTKLDDYLICVHRRSSATVAHVQY